MIAGAGLCDEEAVGVLVAEGPEDIGKLVALNVPFDLDESGDLMITREGGHRKKPHCPCGRGTPRDANPSRHSPISSPSGRTSRSATTPASTTSLKTARAPSPGLSSKRTIRRFISSRRAKWSSPPAASAQVYKSTTNPSVATGDGIAAAMRAGAVLKNIEFVQFHPTGLWSPMPEDREFLISEAVRGEGGFLINREGVRFMEGTHELNELAPRDIVARAIVKELARSGDDHVFIDITSKSEDFLKKRFSDNL